MRVYTGIANTPLIPMISKRINVNCTVAVVVPETAGITLPPGLPQLRAKKMILQLKRQRLALPAAGGVAGDGNPRTVLGPHPLRNRVVDQVAERGEADRGILHLPFEGSTMAIAPGGDDCAMSMPRLGSANS